MKTKESSPAVIVALISLCGVLGAALISKWDTVFPPPTPPPDNGEVIQPPTKVPEFNLFDHAEDAEWTSNDDINKKVYWMSMSNKIFSPTVDICSENLEDDQRYAKTIFTHPAWKDDGFVQGAFDVPMIGKGQHFLADVGFWYGAQDHPGTIYPGDGVNLYVYFQGNLIYQTTKFNTHSLLHIDRDLAQYEGAPGTLIIKVDANGGSGQDQFCWVNPRIAVP